MTNLHPQKIILLLALGICWLAGMGEASAQIRVDLAFRRGLYIRFEPVVATVTITNLTGQDLELADDGTRAWFSFQIEQVAGDHLASERLVPPYNPNYSLNPVQIGAGQRITRLINITPLYPISDYGVYRVKATVYVASLRKYFSSAPLNIEITEGRTIWEQKVGVPMTEPGGGTTRTVTLLSHRLPDHTQLYLRIRDEENGLVFCTHQIGRYVSFSPPQVELDPDNSVNILQNVAPKTFLYTHVALNGEVLERKIYNATSRKPSLVRGPDGKVTVAGGIYVDPKAAEQQGTKVQPPSVTDRPVPLPTPAE